MRQTSSCSSATATVDPSTKIMPAPTRTAPTQASDDQPAKPQLQESTHTLSQYRSFFYCLIFLFVFPFIACHALRMYGTIVDRPALNNVPLSGQGLHINIHYHTGIDLFFDLSDTIALTNDKLASPC